MPKQDFSVSIPSAAITIGASCVLLAFIAWDTGQVSIMNGIILGHIGSFLYFWFLYWQTFSLRNIPIEQLKLEWNRYMAQGYLARFSLIFVITAIAILLPNIAPLGLIIGLLVPFHLYVYLKMIVYVVQHPHTLY